MAQWLRRPTRGPAEIVDHLEDRHSARGAIPEHLFSDGSARLDARGGAHSFVALTAFTLSLVLMAGGFRLAMPFWGDQALFTIYGRELTKGAVLYRDVFDVNQPGIFIYYAIGGLLFGFTEVGIHLFELGYWVAFSLFASVALRRYFTTAWAAPLVPICTVVVYYLYVDPVDLTRIEMLIAFPILLAWWLLDQARPGTRQGRSAVRCRWSDDGRRGSVEAPLRRDNSRISRVYRAALLAPRRVDQRYPSPLDDVFHLATGSVGAGRGVLRCLQPACTHLVGVVLRGCPICATDWRQVLRSPQTWSKTFHDRARADPDSRCSGWCPRVSGARRPWKGPRYRNGFMDRGRSSRVRDTELGACTSGWSSRLRWGSSRSSASKSSSRSRAPFAHD